MHPALIEHTPDCDIASKFWTSASSAFPNSGTVSARNLYELFVHDLSSLVSGACQANRAAHALYNCLPGDQIGLRRIVLGLAKASRSCLPMLPQTLIDEGLILPPAHDTTVSALLSTLHPESCGHTFEPWSVIGARVIGVLHKVALHLQAQTVDAAENAVLLGSESLHDALREWSDTWNDYIVELRTREPGFRAQAYAAGLMNPSPLWQVA